MNNIDDIRKRIKNKNEKENKKFNLFVVKFFIILLCFALGSILVKNDPKIKTIIYEKVYNSNFSFAKFKNIYNTYIGNILPFNKKEKTKKVFNEKLEYKNLSKEKEGIKLTLENNYPIPIIKGGIVIYTGKKDNMNTVIIQGSDGIDIWYCNLVNSNLKLYDYVNDNDIIGEAKDNTLYLKFYSGGISVDYKKVLR